ncbi:PTS systemfructose- and mannose-inducible IID component [Vibrio maritimus]|uniref:PTS systemfructose-and mannose-inducible IID component n=1 Tax=Vibrio maritimus TaxID=990268 RepID=A0A090RNH5_9VIBR|nr:PTS systemfructose- and mannose-inducible IID component [Vibrio maritimus]
MTTQHNKIETNIEAKVALDKKDLVKCWRSWMMYNLSSMSFERLQALGFCLGMMPALKKALP